jgi:DNA primase
MVGFGGRILGEGEPKYLNSPETPIFYKKDNLYGLYLTKDYIRKNNKTAILVEGYMDLISLYQAGIRNVCAGLGTAFTGDQGRLLKKYADTVILCYDGDAPGRKAALRNMDALYSAELNVKVMLPLPDDQDPDDYIKSAGKTAFLKLAAEALPFADYKLHCLEESVDLSSPQGRIELLNGAAAFLSGMKTIDAEVYYSVIAERYDISAGALREKTEELRRKGERKAARREEPPDSAPPEPETAPSRAADRLELTLLRLILEDNAYLAKVDALQGAIQSEEAFLLLELMKRFAQEGRRIEGKALWEDADAGLRATLRRLSRVELSGTEKDVFASCEEALAERSLKRKESELLAALQSAGAEEAPALLRELQELQRRRRN